MKHFPDFSSTVVDCQRRLPYEDGQLDQIIAAIDGIQRVFEPEGARPLVIPCDPCFAYKAMRKILAKRIFRKRHPQPYKWLIRRGHINLSAEIENEFASKCHVRRREHRRMSVPPILFNLYAAMLAWKG